jgi:hypothetical protein
VSEPTRSPAQLPQPDDSAPRRAAAEGDERAGRDDAPFVTTLRARPETIHLGDRTAGTITVRVQMPEVWDTVRLEAPADEPVLSVKVRALAALYPDGDFHEDFVLKLRGFEVIDELSSLADAGAVDGSIFLLTHRRRRPVR